MKRLSSCLAALMLVGCSMQADTEENQFANAGQGKGEQEAHGAQEEDRQGEASAEKREPQYEVTEDWSVKPISEDANEKVVLLTIDDAPDQHALEMAKTLHDLDVKAIFFVNGHFLDSDEEKKVLQKIHDMGFPIGNHTMTHANLSELPEDEQREEILGVNELVEEAIGEKPHFFRAPHGVNTDVARELARKENMLLMNWTYGYDWEQQYQNADAITDIMVNTELLHDGSILLMHDRAWTNAALKEIVTGLQEKGYEILDPALIDVPEAESN